MKYFLERSFVREEVIDIQITGLSDHNLVLDTSTSR